MEVKGKNSRMLTTTEVAHLLHVHPNTVRRWANEGFLPVYRLGTRGDRRFKRKEVEAFIESNSHKSQ
jgi:excisionase family DNA binding protein